MGRGRTFSGFGGESQPRIGRLKRLNRCGRAAMPWNGGCAPLYDASYDYSDPSPRVSADAAPYS
jgi:hypothetical protein